MATELLENARSSQEIAQNEFDMAMETLTSAETSGTTEEIEAATLARDEAMMRLTSATSDTEAAEMELSDAMAITTEQAQELLVLAMQEQADATLVSDMAAQTLEDLEA